MSRKKSDYFIQTLHKVHFIKIIFGHMWRLKSCQKQFSLAKSYNLQFSACSKTLYHLKQLWLSFSYCFWYAISTCINILVLSCPFSAAEYRCMLSMCLPDHLSLSTNKQRKLGNRAWYLTTSQEAWVWFSLKPYKFLPPLCPESSSYPNPELWVQASFHLPDLSKKKIERAYGWTWDTPK